MSKHIYQSTTRLGKMPAWQKWFVLIAMLTCSLSGIAYLLGHQFFIQKDILGLHSVLSCHGIAAMIATLALGTILPFHLNAGLKAKRKMVSGISQLGFLVALLISGILLYYGPVAIRESIILTHWVIGLIFFVIFILHGLFAQLKGCT